MTQIVLEKTRTTRAGEFPEFRFQVESSLPPKPATTEECCPHCQQTWYQQSPNALQRIRLAIYQLLGALALIVFSVLRLARLAIAMAFSLVGVIGFGLHNVALRIAHPDDRRLLPRSEVPPE